MSESEGSKRRTLNIERPTSNGRRRNAEVRLKGRPFGTLNREALNRYNGKQMSDVRCLKSTRDVFDV